MNTRYFSSCISILVGGLLFVPAPHMSGHVVSEEMALAANRFLEALSPAQRAKASFEWKAEDRHDWHYIPKERKGITFKEMNAAQRQLALALLRAGLSDHGYGRATNIMSLEPILAELEGPNRRIPRDPDL